ncbi:S8 family serine peptidase, partial [Euryarchaeota archaeon]|nr:S8 family serine peptidase [Euryarchaeota archaeon]
FESLSATDVLFILGIILGILGFIITIWLDRDLLALLIFPFFLIYDLFSKDEEDDDSNWSEIPTNLVSDDISEERGDPIEDSNSPMREISIKNKNDDAIKIVVGVSLTLITTFVFAVVILWAVSTIGGTILGLNPPQALVTWEDEYRDITGINSVEYLDGTGVTLCIVDSGINIEHPDLANINLIGWKDVINTIQTPYDDDGHGTAMAGIIVADGGLNGVSKNVDLLIAKAIDDTGSGTDDGIAEAVNWCTTEGADIISLSLGGAQGFGSSIITTDTLETAVENAIENGVYVVAAAGNDGGENDDGDVSSPGSVDDVICVGGITRLGNLWVGSSEGDNNGNIWPPKLPRNDPDKKPEIVAPGHEVPVLVFNAESWWGWSSGTSASTAWVSGALALFLEEYPEYQRNPNSDSSKVEEIKELISLNSQMKESQNQHDDKFGYGILRIDLLIESIDNSSDGNAVSKNYNHKENAKNNIFDIFQMERRMTASVPPDNSANAIE